MRVRPAAAAASLAGTAVRPPPAAGSVTVGDRPRNLTDRLRVPPGPVDLSAIDPQGKPGFRSNKADGRAALAELGPRLADLQEQLFAHGFTGGERRLLLVVQGMDTSGKGGVMKHVVGQLDPQGVRLRAFKAPTPEERQRGFLWRIRQALPAPGQIGVFDRSHYEDVLIARVNKLARPSVIERRYQSINNFERELVELGCDVVKVMLHISNNEQRDRLAARLDRPHKHWKYDPADVDERRKWAEYQHAYEIALERCNPPEAPWYVIPANRKWYRNLAVTKLLIERLEAMNLGWPVADFDVDLEKKRLAAS
jgi:PPK2 family polyphosphate:nucleotide phosphotransferase